MRFICSELSSKFELTMGDALKTKAVDLLWCDVMTGDGKIVSKRSLAMLKLLLVVSGRYWFGSDNCSFETIITPEYFWGLRSAGDCTSNLCNFFAFLVCISRNYCVVLGTIPLYVAETVSDSVIGIVTLTLAVRSDSYNIRLENPKR